MARVLLPKDYPATKKNIAGSEGRAVAGSTGGYLVRRNRLAAVSCWEREVLLMVDKANKTQKKR